MIGIKAIAARRELSLARKTAWTASAQGCLLAQSVLEAAISVAASSTLLCAEAILLECDIAQGIRNP
jgi:hypothetical protein